jgi:hypothetical protein
MSTKRLPAACSGVLIAALFVTASLHAQSSVSLGWGNVHAQNCGALQIISGTPAISPGRLHTLALDPSGQVIEWGCPEGCKVPGDLGTVTMLAAGSYHSAVLRSDGTVRVWGGLIDPEILQPPAGLGSVVVIAAGYEECLALKGDGSLQAWGWGHAPGTPGVPAALSGVRAISVQENRHLVKKSDNTLAAWLWNEGTLTSQSIPVDVNTVLDFAAGGYHYIALRSNGTVACWSELGGSQTNVPATLTSAVAVAAGLGHCVALKPNGTVVCWGEPEKTGSWNVLVTPPETFGVTRVVAGGNQVFASMPLRDCNGNGQADSCEIRAGELTDCDGNLIEDSCQDCDGDGVIDLMAIELGIVRDWNGNGIPDTCDDPRTLVTRGATPLPVDLMLVADTSNSMLDLPYFCAEVLQPVRVALDAEFDLRVTWFNPYDGTVFDDQTGAEYSVFCGPTVRGRFETFDIQPSTGTPCLADVLVETDEDWGDAASVVCDPNFTVVLGTTVEWSARDSIAVVLPLSDEGPESGTNSGKGCTPEDHRSAESLILQARRWAVPIVPIVFPETYGSPTPACVYSSEPSTPGLMNEIASETGGSTVDARALGTADAGIIAAMTAQIRDAISSSPRLLCAGDTNGDRQINALDIAVVLGAWSTASVAADLNEDGIVSAQDIAIVLGNWGTCLP